MRYINLSFFSDYLVLTTFSKYRLTDLRSSKTKTSKLKKI